MHLMVLGTLRLYLRLDRLDKIALVLILDGLHHLSLETLFDQLSLAVLPEFLGLHFLDTLELGGLPLGDVPVHLLVEVAGHLEMLLGLGEHLLLERGRGHFRLLGTREAETLLGMLPLVQTLGELGAGLSVLRLLTLVDLLLEKGQLLLVLVLVEGL